MAIELGVMKKKLGPLPLWAWGGLVVGAAVVYLTWRQNQAGAASSATGSGVSIKAPETLQPSYAFIDQDQYLVTHPEMPPGGGRPPTPPSGPSGSVYAGPATRKPKPEVGDWVGSIGWTKPQHSNFLAEYRGNYFNTAPQGSAEEAAHVKALRERNASHGGTADKPRSASLIFLPATLPF